jgi:ribosomal protein S27AE
MLIVLVLFMTVLLRFAIVALVVYFLLPATRACPRCGDEAVLIRHAVLRYIVPALEHRWCLQCGWGGLVRRVPPPRSIPQSRVINRAARS